MPQAAVQYGLAEQSLRRMVEDGIIRAIRLPGGEIAVSQEGTDEAISREEEAEWMAGELKARYAHLQGREIVASAAARKYRVAQRTISRWAHRGIIQILGLRPTPRIRARSQ